MSIAQVRPKPSTRRHHPSTRSPHTSTGGFTAPTAERSTSLGAFYGAGPMLSLSAGMGSVQMKLAMGRPDDPFEREADLAADSITNGGVAPAITPLGPGALSQMASVQTQFEEEENEDTVEEEAVQSCACEEQQGSIEPPRVQRQAEDETETDETSVQPLLIQRQTEDEEDPANSEPSTTIAQTQIQAQCADCEAEDQIQAKVNFAPLPDTEKESSALDAEGKEVESSSAKEAEDSEGADAQVSLPEIEPYISEEEAPPIQTQSRLGNQTWRRSHKEPTALQDRLHQSKGSGAPLSPATKAEMGRQFGADLSQVRVHTDSTSAQMNRDLQARAFTHERDIYFNAGEYAPTSQSGKHLLAHELTHTIQQSAVGGTVQRYSAPPQDTTTDPKPERPNDGAEVTGRMNEKIDNDPNVKDPQDLSEEERQEAQNLNRGEVRQEAGEISSSGESSPAVDRGAEAQEKTEAQQEEIAQELQEQPSEATEEQTGEGEETSAELSAADAAAQRADAAQQQAQAVVIPEQPEDFRQPRIEAPVDSAGEALPRNSQIDTQVRGLGYIGQMLREQGYAMKRHAAEQQIGSYGLDAVLERQREDLANAEEGTSTMETHNEARQEIAQQSREAHGESVERQQFVAEKAPDLASKAAEGQEDSGALAGEAQDKASRSQSEIPDDEDARADAEEQSGDMQNAAEGAQSMDQAIRQTGERARQYQQEAESAAEQNQQSEAQIGETEDLIAQTDARVAEMHATNQASQAQIEEAGPGPALIRQHAQQTAQSGDDLIAATIVMEDELNALQDQYLADMARIESREAAIERQQREQERATQIEMSPEEELLFELAGMSEGEQEARVAEMPQAQRDGLLATLERMIQSAPDQGTDATEGARLRVDTGLSQSIMGEQPADPRAEQIQEVENRRIQRVGGVLDIADQNMNFLTAEQQRMLANRLVAESITDSIKNINILQMGKEMLIGMIDPRQSLVSIVGGFEKMLTGFANIGNWEAWQRDPLGNLLQIAADITTGLAMIFSSVLGIAAIITALMVVLTILSWGFLSPVTGPVIAWMGTIMTYAGWGAIISGGLAVYFNYLAYIKNLHDAGSAETARELFGNTEQMKQNATDGFQGAMAVVEGIGAVKMGPRLSSGEFFRQVPRSPGQWASQTLQGARQGISAIAGAPAAIARGAQRLFAGGRQGLIQFRNKIRGFFSRRRGRPSDLDLDTPQARQRHQAHLDDARGKRASDMDANQLRAEVREAGNNRPKRVEPDSVHYRDYDVEIKAGEHTYRRRRDGKGWCRFSAEECFVDLPPSTRRELGIDERFGDDLFDDYLVYDPDLERAATRRARKQSGGRQAQQEALSDIRKTGETPISPLREGVDPKRALYLGSTPGKGSRTGRDVIARMRSETPPRIRGTGASTEVFTVGPDGVKRWYPIRETEMGHIHDAVTYWNNTGRHLGAKHPQVRRWMLDPANYELEHHIVNAQKGSVLGQTQQYLPPTI
ncbi:MAG: DUF4157 domain-containing protein [Caldilineaceae bacterium]|nr:DUF4157 domain-containing protein [Caldilineaceae bacterium]